YAGQIVEEAPVDAVFSQPHHPYTQGLLESMPQVAKPGERLTVIRGQVPRPGALPAGCRFHPRCPHTVDACREAPVALTRRSDVAAARCILEDELVLSGAPAVAEAPTGAVVGNDADATPLLDVVDLRKQFPIVRGMLRRVHGHVHAVDGVTFAINAGET